MSGSERYVAIVTRAIPVEGHKTDRTALEVTDSTTVSQIAEWAEDICSGNTLMVSLELVPLHWFEPLDSTKVADVPS